MSYAEVIVYRSSMCNCRNVFVPGHMDDVGRLLHGESLHNQGLNCSQSVPAHVKTRVGWFVLFGWDAILNVSMLCRSVSSFYCVWYSMMSHCSLKTFLPVSTGSI